jgi:gliding motility-associated-like protein
LIDKYKRLLKTNFSFLFFTKKIKKRFKKAIIFLFEYKKFTLMKRLRISVIILLLSAISLLSNFVHSQTVNVGLKEGTGKQIIMYFTVTGSNLTYTFKDFKFTLKWPVNTVSINSISANYGISDVSTQTDGAYNYVIFSTANLGPVSFLADGTHYNALSVNYTYSGTACSGAFEIENSSWAGLNNGLLTLIGFDDNPWPLMGISSASAANLNPVKITNVGKQDVLCKGENTGSISITAISEFGSLEYSIDNGLNYQPANVFTNLYASTSNIPAIRNTSGCKATSIAININEPTSAVSIFSQTATDITCNNANDGKIEITASGGTGTLQYSINNGLNYQSSSSFLGLTADNYAIRVKDENNCVVVGTTRTINNPPAISITSSTKNDIDCFGNINGSISISAGGGIGSLVYSKDNGVNYVSNGGNFTLLPTGFYDVKVKDANNCTTTVGSFTINEPTKVTITNVETTHVSVCNLSDGQIIINAIGGTGVLQYSKDGTGFQTSNTFANLLRATYYVSVKDENSCNATQSVVVGEQNPVIFDSISSQDLLCYGDLNGELIIHARGGFSPLTYSIDNSNFYTSNVFSNLRGGNYAVFIKDSKGCTQFRQTQILQPNAIEINILEVKNVTTCYNDPLGMIRFSAFGGSGNLEYSLDGENFQISNQFLNVKGGTYDAVVRDRNLCSSTIRAIIAQPEELISNLSVTNISCNGKNDGAIRVAPDGGTEGYNITWNVSDGDNDDHNLINLMPGTYTVTITDQHSCKTTDTVEITMPVAIDITSEIVNLSCFGSKDGEITVNVSGGEAPYRYRWNNNQMTAHIQELSAGKYQVDITDFRQCKKIFSVDVTQPDALNLKSTLTNTSYFGANDGSIVLSVSGGTKPYSYFWSPNGEVTDAIYNLASGDFSVQVIDANYCEIGDDFKISTDLTDVEIPSAFTPNGDGKNDVWILKSIIKFPDADLKIFDSRGYLVYSKKGDIQGWEGTDNAGNPLPGSSLYYYVIEVNKNTAPFKGTVYIIR